MERHGPRIHLPPDSFARAEAWFGRFGPWAVFLGRITPIVRSFISSPAGVLGSPLGPYLLLTLAGSAIWCFGFAAAGWGLGGSWESFHHSFGYADLVIVGLAVGAAALFGLRWIRGRRGARQA